MDDLDNAVDVFERSPRVGALELIELGAVARPSSMNAVAAQPIAVDRPFGRLLSSLDVEIAGLREQHRTALGQVQRAGRTVPLSWAKALQDLETTIAKRRSARETLLTGRPQIADASFPGLGQRVALGILGDAINYFFTFVGNGIQSVTNLLGGILEVPLSLIGSGANTVITAFAGIVGEIPIIGEIVAAILLAANAVLQQALKLPGQLLEMVGNLGKAFASLSPEQKEKAASLAKTMLIDSASNDIKNDVAQTLAKTPPPGGVSTGASEDGIPWAEIGSGLFAAGSIAAFLL